MIPPRNFSATVISNEYIAEETRKTVFESLDSEFTFHTGQFVNVKVEPKVMRAYSVASSSAIVPRFELCVKVVENGKGSGYIDRMQVGDIVEFMGPFGHFGRKDVSKNIVLFGTGTGIAPLKAIFDDEKEKGFPVKVHLVYGVRSLEFAAYNEYFTLMAKENKKFSYDLFVSRPPENFSGNAGRITTWLAGQSAEIFQNTEIIMCGNPAMIKEAKTTLLETFALPKEQVIIEAF